MTRVLIAASYGAAIFAILGAVLTLAIIRQTKPAHAEGDADKELTPAAARKPHFHH